MSYYMKWTEPVELRGFEASLYLGWNCVSGAPYDDSLTVQVPLAHLLDPDANPFILRAGLRELVRLGGSAVHVLAEHDLYAEFPVTYLLDGLDRAELRRFIENCGLNVTVRRWDSADRLRTKVIAAVARVAADVV